jgi:hypothetical protein
MLRPSKLLCWCPAPPSDSTFVEHVVRLHCTLAGAADAKPTPASAAVPAPTAPPSTTADPFAGVENPFASGGAVVNGPSLLELEQAAVAEAEAGVIGAATEALASEWGPQASLSPLPVFAWPRPYPVRWFYRDSYGRLLGEELAWHSGLRVDAVALTSARTCNARAI